MNVRRKSRWLKTLLSLALLAGGVAGGSWYYQRHYPPEAPLYQTMAVSKGVLLQVVTASGQLNPVMMVDVGSQISGIIQELLADYNSSVKKGELIAKIDAATYEAIFLQAEGNLNHAKAALELAKIGEQRARILRESQLNPEADYDKALAELHQAEANVKIQEGVLKRAQVDLGRCSIYAPIDGLVL